MVTETIRLHALQTLHGLFLCFHRFIAPLTIRLNLNNIKLPGLFDYDKIGKPGMIPTVLTWILKMKVDFLRPRQNRPSHTTAPENAAPRH